MALSFVPRPDLRRGGVGFKQLPTRRCAIMFYMLEIFKRSALTAVGIVLPVFAFAQGADQYLPKISDAPSGNSPIRSGEDALGLLSVFARWVSYGFWILAFIFIFVAAFQYFTAAGNPEKVKEANKRLLWAFIAIAVGLMAYGARTFVDVTLRSR